MELLLEREIEYYIILHTIYIHINPVRTQTYIPAAAAPRRAATLMVAARAADASAKVRSTDVSAAAASLIKAASAPDVEASDLLRVCVSTRVRSDIRSQVPQLRFAKPTHLPRGIYICIYVHL